MPEPTTATLIINGIAATSTLIRNLPRLRARRKKPLADAQHELENARGAALRLSDVGDGLVCMCHVWADIETLRRSATEAEQALKSAHDGLGGGQATAESFRRSWGGAVRTLESTGEFLRRHCFAGVGETAAGHRINTQVLNGPKASIEKTLKMLLSRGAVEDDDGLSEAVAQLGVYREAIEACAQAVREETQRLARDLRHVEPIPDLGGGSNAKE